MSIKQNGGVFGRNPTFNDVTIEGQLTFDGDIDINSDLKVDGDLDVTGSGSFASLDVFSAGIKTNSNAAVGFQLGDDSSGSTDIGNIINNAGRFTIEPAGNRKFAVRTNSTKVDSLVIDHNSNVEISSGNLVIGTSGKGIDFSATAGTGTSELLDDYEEGTWTPTITGSTSGSVAGITINRAAYTKIGNQVTVYFYISAVNLDTASLVGNAEIGGLPFNSANSFMQLAAVNYTNFFSFDESDISVGGYVHSGTKVKLLKGSSVSGIPVGELSGTAQVMMFGMTYESS
jgi:hypothetical protein